MTEGSETCMEKVLVKLPSAPATTLSLPEYVVASPKGGEQLVRKTNETRKTIPKIRLNILFIILLKEQEYLKVTGMEA